MGNEVLYTRSSSLTHLKIRPSVRFVAFPKKKKKKRKKPLRNTFLFSVFDEREMAKNENKNLVRKNYLKGVVFPRSITPLPDMTKKKKEKTSRLIYNTTNYVVVNFKIEKNSLPIYRSSPTITFKYRIIIISLIIITII